MRNIPFFARQVGPKFGNVTRNVYIFRMPGGDIPARSTHSVEPRSSLLKQHVCNETGYTTILGQGKKVRRGLGAVAGANIVHWVVEKTLEPVRGSSTDLCTLHTAKSFYTSDIS